MLEMLMQWYRRRFSDPEAIALLVILVAGFGILFFFSGLLAPLLVAIVLAYLLEWPTVRLEHIGCSRRWATSIVLVLFVGILLIGFAITDGFDLGVGTLLPFLGSVAAVVTGHMARSEIRRAPDRLEGDGLAIAGLVLGYLSIAMAVLVVFAIFLFFGGLAAFLAFAGH